MGLSRDARRLKPAEWSVSLDTGFCCGAQAPRWGGRRSRQLDLKGGPGLASRVTARELQGPPTGGVLNPRRPPGT